MSKGFFPKLALTNIRKNKQSYSPYMISCICTVMMYYIMHSISRNKGIFQMYGSEYIASILSFGSIIIAIFSVIFLFYTNSFLIKRRKRELGLYNILGLEKKHIGKMMLYETAIIAFSSILIGLLGGMLLYKFIFMLLLKILSFQVPLTFSVSTSSVVSTILLFGVIFILSLLFNLGQVHLNNPAELLRGSNQGEKEPKIKWPLVLIGIVCLGTGYALALLIESPLSALYSFFIAVICVMIGTYALFTAGSIALLKILKRNKKYYYQINHFTSVSGMIYRMKQNAVGLSNICILCTAILIMLSTTISFYVGQENVLRTRFPQDIMIEHANATDENIAAINEHVDAFKSNEEISILNSVSYRHADLLMIRAKEGLITYESEDYSSISDAYLLSLIPLDDFNQMEGTALELNDDEVYILSQENIFEDTTITLNEQQFNVKMASLAADYGINFRENLVQDSYYIIVKDIETLNQMAAPSTASYYIGFNVKETNDFVASQTATLKSQLAENAPSASLESSESERQSFLSLYGGLLFLGIFLGILFMLATTLIIYYKQVSEGYEDKSRFEIMQKVGMSKNEVKQSIRNQILMIFTLPLVTAIIHIAFAFKILTKILAVLNLSDIPLFIICTVVTIAVFSILYGIVYGLTARTYYKIVQ